MPTTGKVQILMLSGGYLLLVLLENFVAVVAALPTASKIVSFWLVGWLLFVVCWYFCWRVLVLWLLICPTLQKKKLPSFVLFVVAG